MVLSTGAAWPAAEMERDGVLVSALRNPVDKSYRKMVQGMDLFEERHAMAPEASLRYRLVPRKLGSSIDGVAVHVVGDSFELPLAVAPDHSFVLPREAKALKEDASVRSNRKADTMTWRAEIRTPGLPPDTRRLGDLRLECQVGMQAGLVSRYPASLIGRVVGAVLDTPAFCNERNAPYLFFAEHPLFSVALRAGERSQVLSVGHLYAGIVHGKTPKEERRYCDCEALLDRAYTVPLGDGSWPDDTLVELEYMDKGAPSADTKGDIVAIFGEAKKAIRFDSGYEVWAYQYGPRERPLAQTEYVVLFAPSGVVAKTRLRPAPL